MLATTAIFFAWRSWRTWPDILVDFGHELYIPWRLSEGDALYRDLPFTMGPLSQYANSLLFRLFGASLDTLIAANFTVLTMIVVMLFWLFRRCGTPWSAQFVSLFFLSVFAFGQYTLIGNYNYICPYRHEITHGLALGLAELVCLVRFSETRRPTWLIAAGFCLGLVWLTKLELAIPAISAALATVVLTYAPISSPSLSSADPSLPVPLNGFRVRALGIVASILRLSIAALIPVSIAFFALSISVSWKHACEGLFVNLQLSATTSLTMNNGFYQTVSGMDDLQANFKRMLVVAVILAGSTAVAAMIDRGLDQPIRSRLLITVIGLVSGILSAVCISPNMFFLFPTCLPLVLPFVIGVSAFQCWQNPSTRRSLLPLSVISVFALILLPKIILNVRWVHYGFALAMPGTLLLIHLFVHTIPDWLSRRGSSGKIFRAIAVGALSGCASVQFLFWNRIDELKVQPVGEGRDVFYADPSYDDRVEVTLKTIEFLRKSMGHEETLCVFPEGSTINYLLRKRNPTGMLMFNPWEIDVHGGEDGVRESLIRTAPDYLVLVTMDMLIFGRGDFGSRQYGESILRFIKSDYHVVDVNSQSSVNGGPAFQATVYKRNVLNR